MMNDQVTIHAPPSARDAAGQIVGDWVAVATVWADVRFQTGSDVLRNGLVTSIARASVLMRQRGDVDGSMRLTHKGRAYDIKSAMPHKDRRFMFVVCEEAK